MYTDPALGIYAWRLLLTGFFAGVFLLKKIHGSVIATLRPACNNFQGKASGGAWARRATSDIN
jgi:hypothetical protein